VEHSVDSGAKNNFDGELGLYSVYLSGRERCDGGEYLRAGKVAGGPESLAFIYWAAKRSMAAAMVEKRLEAVVVSAVMVPVGWPHY
jgi:hypothetical protein